MMNMITIAKTLFLKHFKMRKCKYNKGIVGLDGKSWSQMKVEMSKND